MEAMTVDFFSKSGNAERLLVQYGDVTEDDIFRARANVLTGVPWVVERLRAGATVQHLQRELELRRKVWTVESHDGMARLISNEIKPVMDGKNQLGGVIKSLVGRLKELPEERQTESLETFRIIWEFFKDEKNQRALAGVNLEYRDILFLTADKVGNLIRKAVTRYHYAGKIDAAVEVQNEVEQETKDLLLKDVRANSWSKFYKIRGMKQEITDALGEAVVKETSRWDKEFEKQVEKSGSFGSGMVIVASDIGNRMYGLLGEPLNIVYITERDCAKEERRDSIFFADPAHGIGVHTDMGLGHASTVLMKAGFHKSLPPLLRPCTFMLVEDNELQQKWVQFLKKAENISMYAPPEDMVSRELDTRRWESLGCYTTARRALEVISGRLRKKQCPPDIILCDIELEGEGEIEGMNGLKFVEKVYQMEKAAGRDPMILMIYSSNPTKYQEEVRKLEQRGIIIGGWSKLKLNHLTMTEMIDAINTELGKRDRKR